MKKMLLALVLVSCFLFADNPLYRKISLENNNGVTKLNFNYSWKQDDQYFFSNPMVDVSNSLGDYYLSQKLVLSNDERNYYKLDFNDGIFVICSEDMYSCSPQYVSSVLNKKKIEEYMLAAGILYPQDAARGVNKTSQFSVLMDKIPDPKKITGIVMIYGVDHSGVQPLNFYDFGSSSSMKSSALVSPRSQKSCEVVYVEITKVEQNGSGTYALIPSSTYKKGYLGDGLIIAPLWIPVANTNSLKTKTSLLNNLK